MNVKDIIVKYLKENGYNGMFRDKPHCSCSFQENSILGCAAPCNYCQPGYWVEKDGQKVIGKPISRRRRVEDLVNKINKMKDIDPEFAKILNEQFWNLVEDKKGDE